MTDGRGGCAASQGIPKGWDSGTLPSVARIRRRTWSRPSLGAVSLAYGPRRVSASVPRPARRKPTAGGGASGLPDGERPEFVRKAMTSGDTVRRLALDRGRALVHGGTKGAGRSGRRSAAQAGGASGDRAANVLAEATGATGATRDHPTGLTPSPSRWRGTSGSSSSGAAGVLLLGRVGDRRVRRACSPVGNAARLRVGGHGTVVTSCRV